MNITYNPESDILRVIFSDAVIQESDEDKPGFILDYASMRVDNPRSIEYTVAV